MFQISLSAARVNANYGQTEAAPLLGITAKTLSNYERGITAIPGNVLKRAAKIYDVPEDMIRLPVVDDKEYDDIFLDRTTV